MNVRIHDTTLRDGEQSPGATMASADRLRIALALESAGTDVIEAGFPAASPQIAASVKEIAASVSNSTIAAFSRLDQRDIDSAWEAIRHAQDPCLFSCIATSDEHIAIKLRTTREDVLERIAHYVRYMATLTGNVMFVAEDSTRTSREDLLQAFTTAVEAGATTVVIADTVGYMQPREFGDLVAYLRERLSSRARLSVHCHDDLGVAVANTLEGLRNGADDVQVTINGIGERAGNCALEEVVVALRVRPDYYGDATFRFKTEHIATLSALVAEATNMPVAKNKAIVGKHAFLHESGIHQDGVLKKRSLYEAIPAEIVGRAPGQLYLGRQSGRSGLRAYFENIGVSLTPEQLKDAYQRFLAVANDGRGVDNAALRTIAEQVTRSHVGPIDVAAIEAPAEAGVAVSRFADA